MTAENKTNEESANEGVDQRSLSIQGSVDESTVVVGDHNVIEGPRYYTTNVFGTFETEQFSVRPSQRLSKDEYRWRQVLVQNVRNYWIEGVLEKSLHNQALIDLGLEERSQSVASPITEAEEFVEDAGRLYPAGTQATDIFDGIGAGRTLLILGEPGAGKTTTLLKLTKTLIGRMGDDFSQSIPVVLNLSSWTKRRKPIAEWLVQSLYETFQVSKTLGTIWIKEEQLTLCLDGLDEVAVDYRDDCLKALNQFLQTHGRTEFVVCSRIRDYEALSDRLKVKCAIYVQPLNEQQIDRYLEQAGEQLSALNTVLCHSPEIKAFAASPLILSVMSLAYRGYSLEELPVANTTEDFQQRLFDTYVNRMLVGARAVSYTKQVRDSEQIYSARNTRHWLVWLAQRMVYTSQTVFFIERMQPEWLLLRHQRIVYRLLSSLFVLSFAIIFTGIVSPISMFAISPFDPSYQFRLSDVEGVTLVGSMYGFSVGLIFGLIDTVLVWPVSKDSGSIRTVENLKWSWTRAKPVFLRWTKWGLLIGAVSGLLGGIIYGLVSFEECIFTHRTLTSGFFSSLLVGAITILLFLLPLMVIFGPSEETNSSKLSRPARVFRRIKRSLRIGIIVGIVYSLLTLIAIVYNLCALQFVLVFLLYGLFTGITCGFLYGSLFGAIICPFYGFGAPEIQKSNIPNQGIRKSVKISIFFGIGVSTTLGVVTSFFLGIFSSDFGLGLGDILGGILAYIWIFGPILVLMVGGTSCIRHLTLRLMLYRLGYAPWNYARFLDYATERLFLQKVGGGYIFIHRMLLEHFSQMKLEQKPSK